MNCSKKTHIPCKRWRTDLYKYGCKCSLFITDLRQNSWILCLFASNRTSLLFGEVYTCLEMLLQYYKEPLWLEAKWTVGRVNASAVVYWQERFKIVCWRVSWDLSGVDNCEIKKTGNGEYHSLSRWHILLASIYRELLTEEHLEQLTLFKMNNNKVWKKLV